MKRDYRFTAFGALFLAMSSWSAPAQGDSHTAHQEVARPLAIVAKPGMLGAGLETSYRLTPESTVGLGYELTILLVTGQEVVNAFYRHTFGKSFFLQGGLGVGRNWFHDYTESGWALHSTVGNEWRFHFGLLLGADWMGVQGVARRENGRTLTTWYPDFPKFRIGYAF